MDNSKCTRCNEEFKSDDNIVYCPTCEAYHHLGCWRYAGGCSNPKCSDYVGEKSTEQYATKTQYTNSNTQISSDNYEDSKNDSNKKTKKISKALITTLIFLGTMVVSFLLMILSFEALHLETLGYVFLAIFAVSIFAIVIFWSVKLIMFAVNDVRKATREIIEESKSLSKEKKPLSGSRKRMNVISTIGFIIFIAVVILLIYSYRYTANYFANNLGGEYKEVDVSISDLKKYGFSASKYGIEDCILATNRYNNNTVIIVECRTKAKARQAVWDCDDLVDVIRYETGKKAVVKRKANCILVGTESAVKDALD